VETVLERPDTDVAMSELLAAPSESLTSPDGDVAEALLDDCAEVADFSACYARELSSLVWFVMSPGADSHRAADVTQSTFAEAFVGSETGLAELDDALDVGAGHHAIRTCSRSRLHFERASHVEVRRKYCARGQHRRRDS
jgi:hypothetical protein